jgi:hypothetical protein
MEGRGRSLSSPNNLRSSLRSRKSRRSFQVKFKRAMQDLVCRGSLCDILDSFCVPRELMGGLSGPPESIAGVRPEVLLEHLECPIPLGLCLWLMVVIR